MRYLISVKYDGSKYYGFQRLKNQKTVQKELEEALTKINKSDVKLKGAGRTDRGVHANDQKCHFDLNINIDSNSLVKAINSLTGDYLYVKNCVKTEDNFHARFDALKKRYIYRINLGEYNPQLYDYMFFENNLNINKMKKASKLLLGMHDFKKFISGEHKNSISLIYKIKFSKKKDILEISFIGKTFYRYMVRNLVGVLLMVGKNKLSIEDINKLFKNNCDITVTTAKPNGLYLDKIWY